MVVDFIRRPTTKKERLRAARAWAEGRETYVPSRNVIVRSPVRILRELVSVKMGCKVPCESSIEYDHFVILDTRHDVASFRAQPEIIRVPDETGTIRRHYPDARVEFTNGRVEIHEVKPDKVAAKPEVVALQALVAAEYARRGLSYVVVTESDIRRQPRLDNARLIRSARMHRPSQATWAFVSDALSNGPLPFAALEVLAGTVSAKMELLALTLRGRLHMEWERLPVGPAILVSLQDAPR